MSRSPLLRCCIFVALLGVIPDALAHAQAVTSVVVPSYMQGLFGTNIDRIPYACRLRLTGLVASKTYRFTNQMVTSADALTSNGSGNCIFATMTGDFVRTQSASLSSAGDYGTFTTDATGAFEGWFITEPTGGSRFAPGKFLFMRIALNNGGSGTSVATRVTTSDSIRVVKLGTTATDSTGTGLRGASFAKERDFVFAYDNTAGVGRPISGTYVERDGTKNDVSNSYSLFYDLYVNGVRGAFGMVLPNLLPTGIRRLERRALATGAVVVAATDVDGLWPSGAQTANPLGGTTAIALKASDVKYLTNGLAIDPSLLSFRTVTVSASKTDSVIAFNPSALTITLNSTVSSDTSAFAITFPTGSVNIPAGGSTKVRIQFHPRSLGQKDARITFNNSGASAPDTIHVDGSGVAVATSVVLPRYIEGVAGTNTNRVPFGYRVKLTKLLASKTYRFYNQVVDSSDPPDAEGSGNPIFITPTDFTRTDKVDFDSTGHYATFTTDATGAYEGWFITEPTAGDRFLPGKFVFMRISLNDGGTGTTVTTRVTSTDSVRVVKLSSGATDSTGTALRGNSFAKERDFVFAYDNTAGTGRPLSGTYVERDGTQNSISNFYAPFYDIYVNGFRGAYGMVLPNLLSAGVRRIERRSLTTGAVVVSATDSDGLWPSGAQTVNPNGGPTAIALKSTDVNHLTVGMAIDPAEKSFGGVYVSATVTDSVIVKNTTGSSFTINSIVSSDTSAFAVTTSTGPIALSGGSTTKVKFVFHPRVPGPFEGRLTFTHSGPGSPDTLHLEGSGVPIATTVLFPRFMEGAFGTNNDRVPFACRLRLSQLLPNTTYRYFNQMVKSSESYSANGAGNPIFARPTGNFARTVTVGLSNSGDYDTLTTDATGTYEGWFITEPTAGDSFVPGKFAFMRIMLNDGGTGTTVSTRATTIDSVRIVKLAPGATDSTGTGLRGTSFASSSDFVFTYDNVAGTGRPISGSFVESDGTANTALNFYSPFYATSVDHVPGAFGTVLPNLLPTGVRRVERRALATGDIVTFAADPDGAWPSGAQTVNPGGGTTEKVLTGSDVGFLSTGLVLTPPALSFRGISISQPVIDTVLVQNPYATGLSISIVSSNASEFGILDPGPLNVAPGGSTNIRVVFHPTAIGPKDGRVTFTHNGASSPDTIHVQGTAVLMTALVPRYLEGASGTNPNRVPFAWRGHLEGLLANHAYHYTNQVVTSADPATSNGGGNAIFAFPASFVRATSPDLGTAGSYGTLTTDTLGVYDGWFITEPTGDLRFAPGRFVFMRLCINDGGTGTSTFGRFTSADSARVLKLGATPTDSTGTGLRGATAGAPREFVFVYDDTASTDRPVAASFLENDGTINSLANGYAAFYTSGVDNVGGAFGVVVPNLLPKGIRRVELRAFADGARVALVTDVDGKWPGGANTVNPTGGATALVLLLVDLNPILGVEPRSVPIRFMLSQNGPNPFHPSTAIRFSVAERGVATIVIYDVMGHVAAVPFDGPATPGEEYVVKIDGRRLPSGVYWCRLKSGNRTATRKMVLLR